MALPVTTNRAALRAAHPLRLVEPETVSSARMPARSPALPFSCSTNLANDVTDHLRQAKLTARAWEVCAYLQRQTFGNAGWHRKRGQPETQCAFDLSAWAAAIPCDRSNLRRTLAELVACQIIWLEMDLARPGSGQIGWNLAFANWQPYDQRRQRGGRKQTGVVNMSLAQQEASVVKNTPSISDHAPLPEARGYLTIPACYERTAQVACAEHHEFSPQQASVVRNQQELDGEDESKRQFDHARLAKRAGNLTTLACQGSAAEGRSSEQERKRRRKKATETPLVVSEALCASSESLLGSSKTETTQGPPVSDADHPPSSPVPSTDQAAYWPPRQPHERTDLDYYQRVLREREQQRVALLVRLAHERIGVPLEKASYARIGVLAKQCGAALLVKHILLAAANHIDGDPLDYLTRLARGQQRKETTYAERAAAPTSGYRPYTAEEASQLVWNTL